MNQVPRPPAAFKCFGLLFWFFFFFFSAGLFFLENSLFYELLGIQISDFALYSNISICFTRKTG